MLGLLRSVWKTPPKKAPPTRLARLGLERLEGRDVPSTLTLSLTYDTGRQITLSGTLSGCANPSLQTINIRGMASGVAMTNDQGQFSVTVEASGLGDVSATAADGSSNAATVTLTDTVPTLTFFVSEHSGHLYELSGDVSYSRNPANMIVNFGGSPHTIDGQTTSTDTNGHYDLWVMLDGTTNDNGTATAVVTTPWGTTSAEAEYYVHQTGT